MRKILMTLASVLCCVVASNVLTSCSDDDNKEYVYYVVNPDGNQNFAGTSCLSVCQKMNDALKKRMTMSFNTWVRDDSKAISICDQIYNETKANAVGIFTVSLSVDKGSSDPYAQSSTVLKTYEY